MKKLISVLFVLLLFSTIVSSSLKENIELFDGLSCVYKGKKEGDFVKKIVTLQGREIIKAEKGMTVKLFIPGFIPGAQVYLLSQHQGKNLLGENKKVKISLKLIYSSKIFRQRSRAISRNRLKKESGVAS